MEDIKPAVLQYTEFDLNIKNVKTKKKYTVQREDTNAIKCKETVKNIFKIL